MFIININEANLCCLFRETIAFNKNKAETHAM